jgi:broad specificity phosphatase PhoE
MLKKIVFSALAALLATLVYGQTIFIVRHAEKEASDTLAAMMKTDPPLTEAGRIRAEALMEVLKDQAIGYIFATNTIRTKATAEPTRAYFKLVTQPYRGAPDSAFIKEVLSLKKNVLIVGHSNTVDDLVNKISGKVLVPADLPDQAYDNLYMLTRKGDQFIFENRKYGQPSR